MDILLSSDFSFLSGGDSSTGIWSNINSTVVDTGRSAYSLSTTIGVGCAICAAMFIGILLMSSWNSTSRNEAKQRITNVVIGVILLCTSVSIVTIAASIGSKLKM